MVVKLVGMKVETMADKRALQMAAMMALKLVV